MLTDSPLWHKCGARWRKLPRHFHPLFNFRQKQGINALTLTNSIPASQTPTFKGLSLARAKVFHRWASFCKMNFVCRMHDERCGQLGKMRDYIRFPASMRLPPARAANEPHLICKRGMGEDIARHILITETS